MKYQVMPALSREEMEALRASIEMEGVREPIVVDEDGEILDGHHRHKINPDAPRRVMEGLTESEKVAFAIRSNTARRNLSFEQKKDLRNKQKETAKQLKTEDPKKYTQEVLAAILGVAQGTIAKWKLFEATNIPGNNGCQEESESEDTTTGVDEIEPEKEESMEVEETPPPETDARVTIPKEHYPIIYKRICNGEKHEQVAADYKVTRQRITKIYNQIKSDEEEKLQQEERAREYVEDKEKCRLYHGDFYEICKGFDDNSIDCIITDPPYPEEFLPLWGQLSDVASRVLKPGGFCITYTGKLHLPEVINHLSTHLKYYWQLILLHKGLPAGVHPVKINTYYKPILVFYKPPRTPQSEYISDIIQGTGREKDKHEWQQAEEELTPIIEKFTQPNDIILDPFAGSGTTLAACLSNGRRCIGIEKDGNHFRSMQGRVADVV